VLVALQTVGKNWGNGNNRKCWATAENGINS